MTLSDHLQSELKSKPPSDVDFICAGYRYTCAIWSPGSGSWTVLRIRQADGEAAIVHIADPL